MLPVALVAQFAPGAGVAGTTAIHADSSAFVAWATGCTVERGPIRIDQPQMGLADYGHDTLALGVPGGTYDVVSLGDGSLRPFAMAQVPTLPCSRTALHTPNIPICISSSWLLWK